MTEADKKKLTADPDGLLTYEYIANHIGQPEMDIEWLTDNMIRVDLKGQFTASTARYLYAIDPVVMDRQIGRLIAATIDKDREHAYLPALIKGIYGEDYHERAATLAASDDNFRRIYKRLYPMHII
ncbi:MAG: hypothetical protein K2H33_02465 [Muribaculaceae bacterium]|nr:hypothetical protein [Muribaculaceae bacterium]MDE6118334.1 hypothetical protein [Muribaculaceae bacterium]